ncbi:MAG: hypothetical protein J4A00_07390 [Gammaproteobacteria bacterium]|nr:hypothetical protein [Gammaproteobacteria bacterium]
MQLMRWLGVAVLMNGLWFGSVQSAEKAGPPWADQGPRIMFNVFDTTSLAEVVPDRFFMTFWHSPNTTIVHNVWVAGEKGHLMGGKSIHGEEYGYVHKGRLAFVLDDAREHVVVDEGQFMRWPNVPHWGTCMTEICEIYAWFTPTRDDYGSEGTTMTETSNTWISRNQGE